MDHPVSRREFLKTSAGLAVGAGLGLTGQPLLAAGGKATPGEKIVVGVIGVAGRGTHDMTWFMQHADVEIGAVCDVYEPHRERAAALVEKQCGRRPRTESDFRRLLERKEIDAVIVTPPPHWHALITILACQAGKDVYCEKPMCLYPAEARAMVKAAREHGRVTQVGTQIHASENYHRVVETVRSGVLGKITLVRNIFTLNEAPEGVGRPPDTEPPPGLDWEMWLGPAPKKPFNPRRFENGLYRYFRDYVGSWLHEMGPHIVDLPVWALELGPPLAVSASGGKFATDDISDIPDTMEVLFEYPNLVMTWHHSAANSFNFDFGPPPDRGRRLGVLFHGLNGTLAADYGSMKIIPEGDRLKPDQLPKPAVPRLPGHEREFLDAVKSRRQPSCSVEHHYNLHIALNLAHIALETGRKVRWDDRAGRIVGDEEANRLVTPDYRAPWKLPA